MRIHHVRLSLVAATYLFVWAPGLAFAQEVPSAQTPLAEALHGSAREAYTAAKLLFNNGDYEGARTKYAVSYDLSHDPRLLYNMALCDKNSRHYARMQTYLLRYQRQAGTTLSPEQSALVDDALRAIKDVVGSVTVIADVPQVVVKVDGDVAGTTPLAEPLLFDLGKHTLVFHKDGFEPVTREIEIRGNDQQRVDVTLSAVRHVGRIVVTTQPGATIRVDGSVVGTERFEGQLPTGTHRLEVIEAPKVPYAAYFELRDRETRTIDVTLSDEVRRPPLWPWLIGGAALVAGGVVGGYFLFKPDNTTKPVPPGSLGAVQFSAWGR